MVRKPLNFKMNAGGNRLAVIINEWEFGCVQKFYVLKCYYCGMCGKF